MLPVFPHFWETGHGEKQVSEPQLQVCGWRKSLLSNTSAVVSLSLWRGAGIGGHLKLYMEQAPEPWA